MHHPPTQDNTRSAPRGQATRRGLLALLLAVCVPAPALEVAGVRVPESVVVDGATLALNGAGLRSRFFVKVYVGALYLPAAGVDSAEGVLAAPGPKRVAMHMIYDDLSPEKITSAWMDGFRDNTPPAALAAMMPRIERFNALWPSLKGGDVADVDLPAGGGVRVTVNGALVGEVEGEDLQGAVLRIWLGESPADGDLKRGMLGGG